MHSFLTIAVPFDKGCALNVETRLDELGNPPAVGTRKSLDAAGCFHFMSITVIHPDVGDKAHLLIELTADGTPRAVIEKLVAAIGAPLDQILATAEVEIGRQSAIEFLMRHCQPVGSGWFSTPGLNFDGTPGMSVERIKKEARLAERIAEILNRSPAAPSALATLQAVRARLWADDAMKWAFVAEPTALLGSMPSALRALPAIVSSLVANLLWPFLLIAAVLSAIACFVGIACFFGNEWLFARFVTAPLTSKVVSFLFVLLFVFLPVFVFFFAVQIMLLYALLRRKEESDIPDDSPPSAALVEQIMKRENFGAQNHLAAASTMKPGPLRWLTLRAGLWFAGQLAAHFSIPGYLVKTNVIHFARWILLPGTNKLLFMSNFDGTWERYLEDFIELSSAGVTGIWSNTVGFPKTRNLLEQGATDGDRLRRWTRRQQYPTRFWYSAYPDITLPRIRTNAAIRQGIASAETEEDAADWLACFGSSPRPATSLQTTEIPTLVFGGLRPLRQGCCVLLSLSRDVAASRRWLGEIAPDLSYGDGVVKDTALLVGFTQSGLSRLGLEQRHLSTFPVSFLHGNAAPWRSRALGDVGKNSPEQWMWGGPHSEIDAVLLIYAREPEGLAGLAARLEAGFARAGHQIIRKIQFVPVPPKGERIREPFGFVDGISDPVIRGTRRWTLESHRNHVVSPGEFVLGYPDNLGYFPSSPTVACSDDPNDLLPAANPALDKQRPSFTTASPTAPKDLGCNGTFLVVRQLEQDVAAFEGFLDDAVAALAPPSGGPRKSVTDTSPLREWVAAKLVGRWREDGTSLVRHPNRPGGSAPDNDFLFGVEDPNGLRCPFGAHIRRADPRDSFAPGSEAQLAITNRHRILRVGRRYDPQDGLTNKGLVFMCLNTDIERQFEFVQQTWLLAPSFHGLANEPDPILGSGKTMTVPTPSGPLGLKGLTDFVTVKGGAYFFLPGRAATRWLSEPR